MSGTSLDGADAALVEFTDAGPRTLAFSTVDFPEGLKSRLLALCDPDSDSLDDAALATLELAEIYAKAVTEALGQAGLERERVAAIGCHGQTVRHRPERGFSIQLNDAARLAERVGIDVVADFRSRDLAAGGQGAPLVPAFHDAVFRHSSRSRAIVNIGGISNVSYLPAGKPYAGFDCGPGNVLLDAWAQRHLGRPFDSDGEWASRGKVRPDLLETFLADPFLSQAPPKSTGRELFNSAWLDARRPVSMLAEDVQATLLELTARTLVDAIATYCPGVTEIALCGGGARNRALFARVLALCPGATVMATDDLGIPSGHVEAAAFAWLASKCVRREPVNLVRVTGAAGPRILGAIYPA